MTTTARRTSRSRRVWIIAAASTAVALAIGLAVRPGPSTLPTEATGDAELAATVRELAGSLGSIGFGSGRHLAARLGILLDHLGVSDEGDAYIRDVAPHLAVLLWRTGERPDLVRRALRLPGLAGRTGMLLRAPFLALGVTREPRLLRRMSGSASSPSRRAGWEP